MPRFLITTFDERTWKKDEKILFLGEWCKQYSRKNIWSHLDYKVLPYHWNYFQQMKSDYQLIKNVYEKYLENLVKKLNGLHNVNYSTEYWRVIIGPWLQIFIGVVLDKWLSIKEALRMEKISNTWLLDFGKDEFVPLGMKEMYFMFDSNLWHHYIFSQVIIANQKIPYEKVKLNSTPETLKLSTFDLSFFLKKLVGRAFGLVPFRFNKTIFISTNFSKWDLIKLQISLNQFPYFCFSEINIEEIPIKSEMRKELEIDQACNEFEIILEKLIQSNIPKLYVELYPEFRKRTLKQFPKKASTIVTTHGYWAEDGAKLWIAEKKEQGSNLVISQHGGLFGSALIEQSEEHQIKISDRYFTWGWKDKNNKNIRPLPAINLSPKKIKFIKQNDNGHILWIYGSAFSRYFKRMHSIPIGPQCLEYLQDQLAFGKSVSEEVLKTLKLRFRPNVKFKWDEISYFEDAGLGKIIDYTNVKLHKRMNGCRLCVSTDNSTVFLETLAINFPTILFFNPAHWQLRPKAQPFYDELKRVGILHDSPESAAELVNRIFENPSDWWFQSERQRIIKFFCKEFAFTRSNWLEDWKRELKSLSYKI
jgi:putative transferase (TIGR04331 family)